MKLPLYVVSDNHFLMNGTSGELQRRELLFRLFRHIGREGGTLIIGGDFFDFWFDYRHVIPKYYQDILAQLHVLGQSGVTIHYIAGNHDYWDFGVLSAIPGLTFHRSDFSFQLDGKNILFTHGDGLLSWDHGYRWMKKIIRSRLCIRLFRLLHADWGCALAKFVSKTAERAALVETPYEDVQKEIRNFARLTRKKKNTDILLVGHYHYTGIEFEKDYTLIWLGDWLKHFTVTRYDGGKWTQENYQLTIAEKQE